MHVLIVLEGVAQTASSEDLHEWGASACELHLIDPILRSLVSERARVVAPEGARLLASWTQRLDGPFNIPLVLVLVRVHI